MDTSENEKESQRWAETGVRLYREGRLKEALAAFDEAIRLDPTRPAPWNDKGNVLVDLGRHEEALAAYEEAIRLRPNNRTPWNGKGNAWAGLGRHEEALAAFETAIQLDSTHPSAFVNEGNSLDELGRHQEALVAYDKALQLDPAHSLAWNGKGNSLNRLGRHEEALKVFEEAIRLHPAHFYLWLGKGISLSSLRRHEEAVEACDKAMELAPNQPHPWNEKGRALHALGRYEEAVGVFKKAIRLFPKDFYLWNNMGNSLDQLHRHEEALEAYLKAIELKPDLAAAWLGKGNALNGLARHQEALETFEQIIPLYPKDADLWYGKGETLSAIGRYEEALKAYEQAIRLSPDPAHRARTWDSIGDALCGLQQYEEALGAYEEAIRSDPAVAGSWNGKGNALGSLGRYGEALVAYEKATQFTPWDASPWGNKAGLLRAHPDLVSGRDDRDPRGCLRRAACLAWPPRCADYWRILGHAILTMGEEGGMGLLLERLVRRIPPKVGLLTLERVLHRARDETSVAHAVFKWLDDPNCTLQPVERLRLRGQVLLRFGDPIMAREVLDKLDDIQEGERDLGGQLYLVWALREYLEPHDEEADFACEQARKWLAGEFGSLDEMTCYYAGHIALLKDDLKMAREAFERASLHPASLLMGWHIAHRQGDAPGANNFLDMLLADEQERLRRGRTGILFPEAPAPFDPNTSKGQENLQLVLRRFEVGGALMDLLEQDELRDHPAYQAIVADFEERTRVLDDTERYEAAVRTWKIKEEFQQDLERQRARANRQAAVREMEERAADFRILHVAPPCELQGKELEARLAQSLFEEGLSGRFEACRNVVSLMLRQDRLTPEAAVLLGMYAFTKAHYDEAASRAARLQEFSAEVVIEGILFNVLNHCGLSEAVSLCAAIGGGGASARLAKVAKAWYGSFTSGESKFPTYPEFKRHLHRYWAEHGDSEEFRRIFGADSPATGQGA